LEVIVIDWLGSVAAANILSSLNLLATATVAVLVYLTTQRFSRLQVERELRSTWITVDQEALASDESLQLMDDLLHPEDRDISIDDKRRRWVCYMLRNPLENMFQADTTGKFRRKKPRPSLATSLAPLVRDDMFMSLVDNYSPHGFREFCHQVKRGEQ
jgi:hypothetical protein